MEILETKYHLIFLILIVEFSSNSNAENTPAVTLGDTGFYLRVYNGINAYRSKHVSPSLRWNRTLNENAEALATRLLSGDLSSSSSHPHLSDDGIISYTVTRDEETGDFPQASSIVSAWYSESSNYDYYKHPGYNPTCLNFTQMVWKSSVTVGIGAAYRKDVGVGVVVAKFYPKGNIEHKFKQNVIPPRVKVRGI